jgi:putative ABC transport system permease protein
MLNDLGYALRLLRKRPGFTAAVALSLGLGIGANTAIFSLINAVLWRTLPVADPEHLLLLTHGSGSSFFGGFTYQQYRDLRDKGPRHADLAAWSTARFNLSIDGVLEPTLQGQLVSGNYFSVLGVDPRAGRAIGPEDDVTINGHPVAMISYGYWKRRFGLAPSAIGREISISGTRFTIIGTTPPEFFGVEVGTSPDVFVPVMMQPTVMPDVENLLADPIIYSTWLQVIGRLAPGVTAPQAAGELEPLFMQLVPAPKFAPRGTPPEPQKLVFAPAATGISALRRQFSQPLFILMGIVGIVLLIACANTANLLLARAASRSAEIGVRLALGAGRARLVRQLLVESVLLALIGGACGVLIALGSTRWLVAYMSAGRAPIALDLNPDVRILVFTGAVSLLTGILFGLAPALRATRVDLAPALRHVARSVHGGLRAGKLLCVVQVALSLVLLIGAGLFVRSLQRLVNQDPGVARDRVLIVRVEPKGSDQRNIPGTTARLDRIYRDLQARVSGIAGVTSCSLAQFTPTTLRGNNVPFALPSGEEKRALVPMVYPNFFGTMGIGLLAGRDFNEADLAPNSPLVAVVNETFARQAFNGNAVGQRLRQRNDLIEIVGVVRDSRYTNLRGETPPIVYQTFLQTRTGRGQMALYVRIGPEPGVVLPHVRAAVQEIDRDLPLFEVRTLAAEMDAVLIQERLIATLSAVFSTLALVLASVGLYGLLAFSVVERTGEMGIRMALGATRTGVVWTVMREGLLLVAAGVAIGVPAALGVARIASNQISGLLFGLRATDPATIAGAGVLLALVAAAAAYIPARRASMVDPMVALRNE